MPHRSRVTAVAVAFASALVLAHPQPSRAAQPVATRGTPIQHIVVIYQENHSFDEVLGSLCQTRTAPCDGYTGVVTLKDGTQVALRPSPDVVPQVVHLVAEQQKAVDGGAMDGWADVAGCNAARGYPCLTYYRPAQIPNLARLAAQYAVSDRTFSMANSPSWGGHLYAAAASTDGFTGDNPQRAPGVQAAPGWGCDSNLVAPWRSPDGALSMQPSCIPDLALDPATHPFGGAFRVTPVRHISTIFDRLDAAGWSWKIYGQATPKRLPPGVHRQKHDPYIWSICPSIAGCLYTSQVRHLVPTAAVLADAANGTLPAYSVLTPSVSSAQANGGPETSQHNNRSMIAGDNWIGRVVNAIEQGPEALSTAVFITYDDCGCFYDHVPPGVNPDGTRQGPRVPMVVVSPYARAQFTDSTPATFASMLAFTEHTLGLAPLGANDANAYDYADSFDFNQTPGSPPVLSSQPLPPDSVRFLHSLPAEADDPT